jgi:hypothetical protein
MARLKAPSVPDCMLELAWPVHQTQQRRAPKPMKKKKDIHRKVSINLAASLGRHAK